jgi:lipopolysaccharide export LptBFGC system permease protein LptF
MTISESIIIGVVSGLCTSVLIYLIVKTFQNIVIPWYQNIIYSGAQIDGQWTNSKTFRNGDTIQDELITIKQSANKLTGFRVITKRYKNKKEIEIKNFDVKGQIKDRFVYLISENNNKRKIGVSCGLYELGAGGDILYGSDMWTDVGSNYIVHDSYELKRKK